MISTKACPKAGIYFSHYECFGHTSRAIAVGGVFQKRFPQGDLFFVQAGVPQPKAKIDQMGKVYSLPGTVMDRRSFREPTPSIEADMDMRAQACADIVVQEKPDLLITEFFPIGREESRHELIPALMKASAQGSTLLGVAGYPLLIGTNHEWREKILKLYARIIIFSPYLEKEFIAGSLTGKEDKQRYLEFFERNASKITFAGYLLPQQEVVSIDLDENRPELPVPKGACRVAVVRGGGAYYPKLIAEAICASDLLGEEYFLTVVAGPSTTPQELDLFSALAGKKKVNNLVLLKSVSDYEGLIERSDVCVSVAAYHTAVMLLKHRKKAVVIPFEGYGSVSFHEQPARAAMLKERLGTQVLSINDLTAKTLAGAIRDMSRSLISLLDLPQEWFNGAEVLDKELLKLFVH